ncbi:LptF/LptG family permease [Candidatus Pelagibacter sp.]|jgi:lipopolysaccharide export system permease protein|nr:LptF/LptG family permease [Candidatus Pelagibacter sp.]
MKKLIFRKFLLDLFLSFCVLIISLSVIVWVIQAVNYLDFISEDGHGFKVYFLYTLFNFPKIFSKLFLVSLFISLFYIIIKYENDNELSIYWSVGISKINFVNNVLKFSILLLLFQIFLTSYISPKSQNVSKSFIRMSNIDFFPSLIKEKKFIDTLSNLTIYVDEQSKNKKKFKNILIKDQKKSANEYQIIVATEGEIITNNDINYLILKKGEIFSSSNNKDFTSFKFENFEFNLSNFSSKTTIIPKIQENKSSNIIKCYLNNSNINKKFYINYNELRCDKGSKKDITQEIFKRFYQPIFIPILCLIACMQIINNKFNKYYSLYRIMIFILGFSLLFVSEILIKYTGNNLTQDITILIFPIILFQLIYLFLLKKNYSQ